MPDNILGHLHILSHLIFQLLREVSNIPPRSQVKKLRFREVRGTVPDAQLLSEAGLSSRLLTPEPSS